MRRWTGSSLVQMMTSRLFGAKPLSEPMLEHCVIGSFGTNFSEFSIEYNSFSFKKMHLKMSSGKWRPSCLGLNVLKPQVSSLQRHLWVRFHTTDTCLLQPLWTPQMVSVKALLYCYIYIYPYFMQEFECWISGPFFLNFPGWFFRAIFTRIILSYDTSGPLYSWSHKTLANCREDSRPRYMILGLANRSEIGRASRQRWCRDACLISERCDNSNSQPKDWNLFFQDFKQFFGTRNHFFGTWGEFRDFSRQS